MYNERKPKKMKSSIINQEVVIHNKKKTKKTVQSKHTTVQTQEIGGIKQAISTAGCWWGPLAFLLSSKEM